MGTQAASMSSPCCLSILFVLLFVAAATCETLEGTHRTCLQGREHQVHYNVKMVNSSSGGPAIYDVDTFSGLKRIDCDADRIKIVWHDQIHSSAFWIKVKAFGAFLVGSSCPLPINETKKGFLLRRVTRSDLSGQAVIIYTVPASYDQIYEDADISYQPTGISCDSKSGLEASKRICVGVNTDDTCEKAARTLPIYANDVISLACTDCFVGLRADVFFALKIKGFVLQSLKAGFRQVGIQQRLQLDMHASKSWSAGVDRSVAIVPNFNLIDFKIGPVPFVVWFETPLHILADASLSTSASASAGLLANFSVGDYYVSWDPKNHWTHVKPAPATDLIPSVSGSADFAGSASLTLAPTFRLHANKLFTYELGLTPNLHFDVSGSASSREVCEATTYDVSLASHASLHLNIDWANVRYDKEWGPKTLWEKKGNVSQVCSQPDLRQ